MALILNFPLFVQNGNHLICFLCHTCMEYFSGSNYHYNSLIAVFNVIISKNLPKESSIQQIQHFCLFDGRFLKTMFFAFGRRISLEVIMLAP